MDGDPDVGIERERDPLTGLSLPQAVAGALRVNPEVFDAVPLRIEALGDAITVTVALGEAEIEAQDPDNDGTWFARLPTGELQAGVMELRATAMGAAGEQVAVSGDDKTVFHRLFQELPPGIEVIPLMNACDERADAGISLHVPGNENSIEGVVLQAGADDGLEPLLPALLQEAHEPVEAVGVADREILLAT